MNVTVIASAIGAAKSLLDVVDAIRNIALSHKPDDLPESLRNEILGNESKAREQNAKMIAMISANAYPFLLRLGSRFELPPDQIKADEAVLSYNIWDWTYCFDFGNVTARTKEHLRYLFCDPSDPSLRRAHAASTAFALSEKEMHPELGDTLYIAGVTTFTRFDHVYNIGSGYLMPAVVIRNAGASTYGIDDSIAMNYYLKRALDFLYASARDFPRYGQFYVDQADDANRKLPPQVAAALSDS